MPTEEEEHNSKAEGSAGPPTGRVFQNPEERSRPKKEEKNEKF